MKVEFRFNGNAECLLIPENAKDKQLIQMCFEGHKTCRVGGDENIVLTPLTELFKGSD